MNPSQHRWTEWAINISKSGIKAYWEPVVRTEDEDMKDFNETVEDCGNLEFGFRLKWIFVL